MGHAFHAYVAISDESLSEDWAFESVKALFEHSDRVGFSIHLNPFANQNILKLTVDGIYSVSVFFEKGRQVSQDLEQIVGEHYYGAGRIRVLFGPDPENEFDDIAVIIYDFMERLQSTVIYSANQEKVLHNSIAS